MDGSTERMTRDEVLDEFRSDACTCECEAWSCIVDRNMADEIVWLRKENDIVVSMMVDQIPLLNQEQDTLAAVEAERDRADRILAALREPSEAVTKAAVLNYGGDLTDAIRAAVAAAEKETSTETTR
jgi:hypothetical protein